MNPPPLTTTPLGPPHSSGRDFDVHLFADHIVKVARPDPSPELTRQRERQLQHEHETLTDLARDRRARHHVPPPGTLSRLPDGRLALTRPKVEGTSLAELVERALIRRRFQGARRWNAPTRQLALALITALESLHRAGWVHNDLKPEDILIQADGLTFHAVLIDLGLAAAPGRSGPGGTLVWAAPERLLGHPGTTASDIWALGALLYLVFTGRPPYPEGEDGLTNAVDARLAREVPLDSPRDQAAVLAWRDLTQHGQEVGVDLCRALTLATASNPKRRPSLRKLAKLLELGSPHIASSHLPNAASSTPPNPTPTPLSAARATPFVAPLLTLLLMTALGLGLALGPASRALGLTSTAAPDPIACDVVRERAERLCRTQSDPRACVETLVRADDCRERAALLGACGGG